MTEFTEAGALDRKRILSWLLAPRAGSVRKSRTQMPEYVQILGIPRHCCMCESICILKRRINFSSKVLHHHEVSLQGEAVLAFSMEAKAEIGIRDSPRPSL